jgi:hypothetical protein
MSLPEWLVERAALDEVGPASRDRIERADPRELADRVAAVRSDNAAELAHHPAGPAVAQIDTRVAAERKRRAEQQRRRRLSWLGVATTAAAVLLIVRLAPERAVEPGRSAPPEETMRAKGAAPRLLAFRQISGQSGHIERLEQDAVVRAGDLVQLRYNPGGQGYGVIASIDGAGVVTLHFPFREDAPPQATAVAPETTTLPHAYALDDAPRFERFFLITANDPVDVQLTLAALRSLARREDSATAALELPAGHRQWSLRLRKPDPASTHELP